MYKISIILFLLFYSLVTYPKYTIVIHGGAGGMNASMPPELQNRYMETLDSALQIGVAVLENNGCALDAVEKVIKYLEDCPLYNAGKGAVYTFEGSNEMDASIMDGSNLKAGAVAGVGLIKNPISAARKVMEASQHVMLSGSGAVNFAREQGLETVDSTYFFTDKRYSNYLKAKEKYLKNKMGTVGCVVRDDLGNLAAGTSTGGMNMKRWGRIGDSPIIGAGTYADNTSCAVSCTGHGEFFIRLGIARDIAARMEYKTLSLKEAATETLSKLSEFEGSGGFIAVDSEGEPVMLFNTKGMFRGYCKSNGEKEVQIF